MTFGVYEITAKNSAFISKYTCKRVPTGVAKNIFEAKTNEKLLKQRKKQKM